MEKGFMKVLIVLAVGLLGLVVVGILFDSVRNSALNGTANRDYLSQGKNGSPYVFGGISIPLVGTGSSNSGGQYTSVSGEVSSISLSVSIGNGEYEVQPYKEYASITNTGSVSVDITGMTLKNGRGDRPIETRENSYVYPSAETAIIPKGAKTLAPSGAQTLSDIVLNPGDTAYIVTGNPTPFTSPINVSFKENICTGYLGSKYSFEPHLSTRCPLLSSEPDSSKITKECYDYVRYNIGQCQNPEDTNLKLLKEKTTLCQSFVKSYANYPSCVAHHYNDNDFYGNNWYIFLGRGREMWGTDDSITLIDRSGKIVAKSDW
jgi:hypothetical protein